MTDIPPFFFLLRWLRSNKAHLFLSLRDRRRLSLFLIQTSLKIYPFLSKKYCFLGSFLKLLCFKFVEKSLSAFNADHFCPFPAIFFFWEALTSMSFYFVMRNFRVWSAKNILTMTLRWPFFLAGGSLRASLRFLRSFSVAKRGFVDGMFLCFSVHLIC